MLFSVRVEGPGKSYQTEIDAVSAEEAIRKLRSARKDAPTRFVFLRHRPSKKLAMAGAQSSTGTSPRTTRLVTEEAM